MDISEKKNSEKALQESERKYRLLIDNLPNIVFKAYPDGTMELVDDRIEALTGYTQEEFRSGKINSMDLMVEEDVESAKKDIYAGIIRR